MGESYMNCKRLPTVLILFLSILLLAACSDDTSGNTNEGNNNNGNEEIKEDNNNDNGNVNDNNDSEEPPEDITLRFWYKGDHDEVEERLNEVFPHITFEWDDIAVINSEKEGIEDAFAEDHIPDIMVLEDYSLSVLDGYDMLFDITDLIESHDLDMDSWPEYRVQSMHAHKPDDEGIYSLPGNLGLHGLAYNKKVFDTFGVDYPTDDMTWDEVIDLAKKVTGERDGVQYRGLDIANDPQMVGMLDDWLVNADDEVQFEGREDIKEVYELIETVADIPGNIPDNDKEDFFDPWSYGIYNEGNVAMTVHARYIAQGLEDAAAEGKIDNDDYDFVSWPILDEDNPTQPYTGGTFYSISPHTEYPDEAFKVIEYLTSDEWLEESDPLDYGSDVLKDKNMAAFERHPLNVPENRSSQHQVTGRWLFGIYANKIIYEDIDVNTAIREAQEEAEAEITDSKGAE